MQQQQTQLKYYSVDVEAVATGTDHNSRAVAQISLIDQYERVSDEHVLLAQPDAPRSAAECSAAGRRLQVVLNLYVKPSVPVVSYLTALTGLTQATLDMYGRPLEESLRYLREQLPRHAILVGQNIRKDVEWLGLKEGVDFESLMDLVRARTSVPIHPHAPMPAHAT